MLNTLTSFLTVCCWDVQGPIKLIQLLFLKLLGQQQQQNMLGRSIIGCISSTGRD